MKQNQAVESVSPFFAEIKAACEGEIYGAAWFEAMANMAWAGEHRDKLLTLAMLERRMQQVLEPLASRLNVVVDWRSQEEKGRELAAQSADMSWCEFLDWLHPRLAEFVAVYDRLADEGPRDGGVLDMLALHERALLDFCTLEREGRTDESLDSVRQFLDGISKARPHD